MNFILSGIDQRSSTGSESIIFSVIHFRIVERCSGDVVMGRKGEGESESMI